MNPHELNELEASTLSEQFCASLSQQEVDSTQDIFTQLEFRFRRSRQFFDEFFPLGGRPEVRALHISDPLVRCVARLEYLLEQAGERARAVTEDAILRQIVESRERGFDLIRALAGAPEQGLTAGELAGKLGITPQNLSPLITTFHAQGILHRSRQGKNAFLTLTPEGHALVPAPEHAPEEEPDYPFLKTQGPLRGLSDLVGKAA